METVIVEDAALWLPAYDPAGSPPTPVIATPEVKADPTKDYVAGGDGYVRGTGDLVMPDTFDDLTRSHGHRAYDLLMTMPAISSSVRTLILGMMASEITFTPTYPRSPGSKSMSRDERRAQDAVDFSQRLMNRVPGFRSAVHQLYYACAKANKLGEMTGEIQRGGVDSGRMVLKAIKVKRREAWQFIVNGTWDVVGIRYKNANGTYNRVSPDKFIWFTWMPEDNDPRGTSLLRAAYAAWSLAVKMYPQYYKYLKQFAVPSLAFEMAENDTKDVEEDGVIYTSAQWAKKQIIEFQNGSVFVHPKTGKLYPIAAGGDGQAILSAFEYLNREMVYAVLMQTRATREAENGSKADSQTSTDIFDMLVQYGREAMAETLRYRVFWYFLMLNFGKEYADQYTPYVYFGTSNMADTAARWSSASPLFSAPNLITPSMLPEMRAKLELPEADEEADARAAEDALKRAQAAMGPGEKSEEDGESEEPVPENEP